MRSRVIGFVFGMVLASLALITVTAQVSSFPPRASAATSITCQATVTLTDAQIKATALGSAFTVVAAPAANLAYRIHTAVLRLDATAGAYSDPGSGVYFVLNSGGQLSNRVALSGFVNNASITARSMAAFQFVDVVAEVLLGNDISVDQAYPIELIGLDSPELTGGHASNTLMVSVLYSILNTTTGVFAACP